MSAARHLPTMVALALAPPIAVIGALGLGLALLEALTSWCPCGSPHGCTHGGSGSSHASTHGAHTAHTAPDEPAGQTPGRGLTAS